MTEINMESLFNEFTSPEQVKESFDRLSFPTGRYTFKATKAQPQEGGADHPLESLRGRKFVSVFGRMSEQVDGVEKKRGSVGFDASWVRQQTCLLYTSPSP